MDSENRLLSKMEDLLSSRLKSFEQKISESQRQISDTQLTKIQQNFVSNDNFTFKKKGNEEQFKVNVRILGSLREADGHLTQLADSHESDRAEAARRSIKDGIDTVLFRNKLIKMADSSELGWRVVQEYEANPLASDSEDEKKIHRAQMHADRKVRQQKRSRDRRFLPYNARGTMQQTATSTQASGAAFRGRKPGVCFRCGRPGHWQAECGTYKAAESTTEPGRANKLSTLLFDSVINVQCCKKFAPNEEVQSINLESPGEAQSKSFAPLGEAQRKKCAPPEESESKMFTSPEESQSKKFAPLEEGRGTCPTVLSPVGKLREHVEHWEKSGANSYILDLVRHGYKLPFKTIPSGVEITNNKSARSNPDIVSEEIQKLLDKRCVSEVEHAPHVVNPLTVAFNRNGKARLVLDCRHINPHLFKFKCTFEDQSVARKMFTKGDFLFTFDLKSAYHHIEIFEDHRTYLGFSWFLNGKKRYFIFNVLPFGISVAGFIFTKTLRVVVKHWRSIGHRVVMFLDDGLGGHRDPDCAAEMAHFVRSDLQNFGFLLADDKCIWVPLQRIVWLGYVWDASCGKLAICDDRLVRFEALLHEMLALVARGILFVAARVLACLIGQLMSMKTVVGSMVRLRSRGLYACVEQRASWNAQVKISSEAFDEMLFWKEHIRGANSADMSLVEPDPVAVVRTDASGVGFGGFVVDLFDSEVVGSWSVDESILSSTWRELAAVHRVLESRSDVLEGKKISVQTDNKNVSNILKSGSRKADLQKIAVAVDDLCRSSDIEISTLWVPRSHNEEADILSRCGDSDDWSVHEWVFNTIDRLWGPHTIDRFAYDYNAKCLKFNSRFWCQGTAGVDAFKQSWAGEVNWLVPPPRLVNQCVSKAKIDKCRCTLLMPVWKSAPFWPVIYPNGRDLAPFVRDVHYFGPGRLTRRGRGKNGIFDGRPLPFGLLAVRITSDD